MLVENQLVEVRWSANNKKWFESKGYKYTKLGDTFICEAEDLMQSSKIKVKVECDYCGTIVNKTYGHYIEGLKNTNKSCCNNRKCVGKKIKETELKNVIDIQYNKYLNLCKTRNLIPLTKKEEYDGAKGKLKYLCKKHGNKETTLDSFEGSTIGCPDCANEWLSFNKRKTINEVIKIVEGKNNNILLNPEDYINMNTANLKIQCGSCGRHFYANLANIRTYSGKCWNCAYNGERLRLSINEVVNRIESKNNNILLNPDEYINGHTKNLKVLCGSCNREFNTSLTNYKHNLTGKCPDCNELSYGEYIISHLLDKYRVNYTRQEHFNGDCRDIRPLPFDFYLPNYDMCIEFDGEQHFKPKFGEETFLKTILHDGMKNKYCEQNNIKLLRIPYWEGNNIEDILIKELDLKSKAKKIIYIPTAQRKQNKTA